MIILLYWKDKNKHIAYYPFKKQTNKQTELFKHSQENILANPHI